MVWRVRSRMAAIAAALVALCACASAPYTRRSQLILLPESQDVYLGTAAYREILGKKKVVTDPNVTEIVARVGGRIARVADKPGYQWEFSIIDDPEQVNAFALPGGKVAVFSGLFPVARDEAGLAAVISHEVAHAIARHGAERMSQGLLLQLGAVGLSVAVGGSSPATRDAIFQAYGLGSQVGLMLPFGRAQESEADRIGLILMARAGYDPSAAITLWERMEAQEQDAAPPEFLSTHPSYETRRQNIRAWLPEAKRYYTLPPDQSLAILPTAEELAGGDDAGGGAQRAR